MTVSGAVIRRVDRPADRFTIVSNEFVRDMRLSAAARGAGLWLLSHAEGFSISSVTMARQFGVGRDQVRGWLAELEHHRYLRRTRLRSDRGRLGAMVYEVRCTPFPPEPEKQAPSSDHGLHPQALDEQAPVGPHHKKTSPKDNTTHEETPSGGTAGAVAAEAEEEAPEMPRTKAPEQPGLFEVVQTRAKQAGKTASQAVVAAFVDSHRQAHGSDPTRSEIGRVARDVASLIGSTPIEKLMAAATAMGCTRYANISMQLKILARSGGDKGRAAAHPHGASEWDQGAHVVQADASSALQESPELAAWLAGQAAIA